MNKKARIAEAYGMGDVKIGQITGRYPNASFIAFTPATRPKCPVCGCLGVVSVERKGGEDTLYYCAEQRHPYYLPQRID